MCEPAKLVTGAYGRQQMYSGAPEVTGEPAKALFQLLFENTQKSLPAWTPG